MSRKRTLPGLLSAVILLAALLAACGQAAPGPADEPAQPPVDEAGSTAPGTEVQVAEPAAEEPAAQPQRASGDGTPISAFETVPVVTSANSVVGVGSYAAAEAYAIPAGEDPAAEPVQAIVMPYAIHPNMHVEDLEGFEPAAQSYRIEVGGFEFEWSLETPDGSGARLEAGDGVARWQADVAGDYVLTLTATDEAGNSGTDTWTVTATAPYTGVGTLTGEPAQIPECAACHSTKAAGWAETGHANLFKEAIDGQAGDHYGPNCVWCHTTGFNNRPEAENGGFDDIAREAGWEFPAELAEGNWEQMVEQYPEVASMATIQCESCHGPGAAHVTGDVENAGPIGTALEYGVCAQCHAEDPYHVVPQQWENSAHADRTAHAFWYPIGEDHAACVTCHTGGGYIDTANGVPVEERRTEYQPITCAVCHDPHDASTPAQLRIFDAVTLPDGTQVAEAGAAATCMTCHNTRVDPVASVEGERFSLPHYSAAAELINGTGGYTWGEQLPSILHSTIIEDSCVACHMAETPGMTEDGEPLPGHNEIGGHSFAMVSASGEQAVGYCQQCHGEQMASFEMEASDDYDGDGRRETNEAELQGLLEDLRMELRIRGVEFLDSYPYVTMPEDASVDLKGAVYNYKLASDNAIPAHNLDYLVALLQLSYERVTGEELVGADLLY